MRDGNVRPYSASVPVPEDAPLRRNGRDQGQPTAGFDLVAALVEVFDALDGRSFANMRFGGPAGIVYPDMPPVEESGDVKREHSARPATVAMPDGVGGQLRGDDLHQVGALTVTDRPTHEFPDG